MTKKGYSTPSIFGGMNHYNEKGKKIGYSSPSLLGGMNHYDEKGKKIGSSQRGFLGGMNHYDSSGKKIGHSNPGLFGMTRHYDADGGKVGESSRGILPGVNHYDTPGHDGSSYGDNFELYTGRTTLDTPWDDFNNGVPPRYSSQREGSSEVKYVCRGSFSAAIRLYEEQQAIDQYLSAFNQVLPYVRKRLRYNWRDNQVVMDKMTEVSEEIGDFFIHPDARRAKDGLPYRMTAYNSYCASEDAANRIIDELFHVIYECNIFNREILYILTDACRFYLYEMERLVKKNHHEVALLVLFLEAELYILEGDWVRAVTCYHQILGWEPLLMSMEQMQDDWPCNEPTLIIGAEDFYEALFVNLVNIYALLNIPECTDHMRNLFCSVYSWLHGVYTRCGAKSEVEKLDASNIFRGLNRYNYNHKMVLECLTERVSFKGAKRVRLFSQTLAETDGITETYMRYVSAYLMPDYGEWDREKNRFFLNGFLKEYAPEAYERQRNVLRDAFGQAVK